MTGRSTGLRRATLEDAGLLFEWANEPAVRAASLDSSPIAWPTHLAWLEARLADPGCRIWIGLDEATRRPTGVVRFEPGPDGRWTVSIAVATEWRGQGRGRRLLADGLAAAEEDLRPVGFRAWVRPGNEASLALFAGAGFVPGPASSSDRVELLRPAARGT